MTQGMGFNSRKTKNLGSLGDGFVAGVEIIWVVEGEGILIKMWED